MPARAFHRPTLYRMLGRRDLLKIVPVVVRHALRGTRGTTARALPHDQLLPVARYAGSIVQKWWRQIPPGSLLSGAERCPSGTPNRRRSLRQGKARHPIPPFPKRWSRRPVAPDSRGQKCTETFYMTSELPTHWRQGSDSGACPGNRVNSTYLRLTLANGRLIRGQTSLTVLGDRAPYAGMEVVDVYHS